MLCLSLEAGTQGTPLELSVTSFLSCPQCPALSDQGAPLLFQGSGKLHVDTYTGPYWHCAIYSGGTSSHLVPMPPQTPSLD